MKPLLVGISGYAGSGKDEAARALIKGGWRRQAFADRLRDFAYRQNPLVRTYPDVPPVRLARLVDDLGWEQAKRMFPQVRDVLVETGNTAREILGVNVWVDAVLDRFRPDQEALVIPDVRYRNEADAIQARGGMLIRIERPGVGPATDPLGQPYESDTALDHYPFDHTYVNEGSIEDMHAFILAVQLALPALGCVTLSTTNVA
ncbi:deoxynucleoside monophosphate [Streptomyces phage Nanodon]|uniref:Deoxynucleoside monophosphate kinase n=1 Tax=Streptomyces phage Nanodon TaxID=1873777 RepID=A0A1B1PA71_9CAUD|nr:deoxynucleoside monophosphate [Streptomyces phage Nanodon]ANT41064.1 deoxynucleoside monophosphate kinase [Streptomyces phage Nanodon]